MLVVEQKIRINGQSGDMSLGQQSSR